MKLKRTTTFRLTIKCLMPTEKLDVFREESFIGEFRLLGNEEIAEITANKLMVKEQLDRVLLAVEGVGGEGDETYTPDEALALIKENTITSMAALHAFNKAASKDIVGKTAKVS